MNYKYSYKYHNCKFSNYVVIDNFTKFKFKKVKKDIIGDSGYKLNKMTINVSLLSMFFIKFLYLLILLLLNIFSCFELVYNNVVT